MSEEKIIQIIRDIIIGLIIVSLITQYNKCNAKKRTDKQVSQKEVKWIHKNLKSAFSLA